MLSGYTYEAQIGVTAGAGGMAAGVVVFFDLETYGLIASGQCRPDRKDYRVVYNGAEIDRVMVNTGRLAFRLQASLGANETTTAYKVNYGKPSETTDPAQDPHNVWNYHYDGSTADMNALTKSGANVSQVSMPCAKLIKYGQGPVLSIHGVQLPAGYSTNMIREVRYFDDTAASGYYYAHFQAVLRASDGKEHEAIARSTDLKTWEFAWQGGPGVFPSWTNEPAIGFGGTIVTKFPWQIDGQDLYYCTTIKADHVDGNGIGQPPYTLWGGYASSPSGPWTSPAQALLLADSEYDSAYCVDGEIKAFWNGASYTYYIIYGAASPEHGQYVGYATATHPMGPYTKQGVLFRSGGENPKMFFDANYAYVTVNPIGGYNCTSNNLYWAPIAHWNEPAYWNQANCVRLMEGTPEAWDAYAINDTGPPIVKNGMAYFSYAGYGADDYHAGSPHRYYSGGLIEGPFPFPWDPAISVGAGSSVATPSAVLASSAAGDILVRIKLNRDSSGFTISGGAESYTVTSAETQDEWYPDFVYGTLTVTVNGTPVAPIILPPNDTAESRTWTLRRAADGGVSLYCGGMKVWQSAAGASSAALSVQANPGTTLESLSSFSDTFTTALPGHFSLPSVDAAPQVAAPSLFGAAAGTFALPTTTVTMQVAAPSLRVGAGAAAGLRQWSGAGWTADVVLKRNTGAGWATIN